MASCSHKQRASELLEMQAGWERYASEPQGAALALGGYMSGTQDGFPPWSGEECSHAWSGRGLAEYHHCVCSAGEDCRVPSHLLRQGLAWLSLGVLGGAKLRAVIRLAQVMERTDAGLGLLSVLAFS